MDRIRAIVAGRAGVWGAVAPLSASARSRQHVAVALRRCRGSPRTAAVLLPDHVRSGYPRHPGRDAGCRPGPSETGTRTCEPRDHATPRYGDPRGTGDAARDRPRARQRAHPSPQLVGQGRLERRQRDHRAQGIYTNGVGSIRYSLKGSERMRRTRSRSAMARVRTLGTIVARPPSVLTSATGTVARRTTCSRG